MLGFDYGKQVRTRPVALHERHAEAAASDTGAVACIPSGVDALARSGTDSLGADQGAVSGLENALWIVVVHARLATEAPVTYRGVA